MVRIALITSRNNGSPKILAETLNSFLIKQDIRSKIFYSDRALNRLYSLREIPQKKIIWLLSKISSIFQDTIMIKELRKFDAIILCGTTPFAFYKDSYNIKKLRQLVPEVPILYYAVQYLGNSPTLMEKLSGNLEDLLSKFDWHLSVSEITEIRQKPKYPWSQIGLYLEETDLSPSPKNEFSALVDFEQPGYEKFRQDQIETLEELGISFHALEGKYSISEIRKLYKQASIYFMQSKEAFGLPIAECLACGTYIFTADSSWPMSWRLDENVEIHGPGSLPKCFILYQGREDLKNKVVSIRDGYDLVQTPKKVFEEFIRYYPTFYYGNRSSLKGILSLIENGVMQNNSYDQNSNKNKN